MPRPRPVDQRIETDALARHAVGTRTANLGAYVSHPFGPAGANVACLRDRDRQRVTLAHAFQHLRKTETARVVAKRRMVAFRFGLSQPPVWKMLQMAWRRWKPSATTAAT